MMAVVLAIALAVAELAQPSSIAITTVTEPLPPTVAEARAYARRVLGATEYGCIDRIFERESRWRVDATNRRSGAYGIPQALPGRRMASEGADWRTNPVTQVKWGIKYVRARYGGACRAIEHIHQYGWY
jgi:hypothetical protein